jgi:capsular polysaccharide transport system ATP-binding protein
MIIVSHEAHNIREHCTRACVLHAGVLREFTDVAAAYDHYNQL